MSDSEALKARDKMTADGFPVETSEDIAYYNDTHNGPGHDEGALVDTPEMMSDGLPIQERLKAIDIELGYGDSTKQPTEEHKNKLLKERLDLLAKLMRRK